MIDLDLRELLLGIILVKCLLRPITMMNIPIDDGNTPDFFRRVTKLMTESREETHEVQRQIHETKQPHKHNRQQQHHRDITKQTNKTKQNKKQNNNNKKTSNHQKTRNKNTMITVQQGQDSAKKEPKKNTAA